MAHIEFLDPVPDPDVTPERAPAPGPPAPARRIPEAALRAAAGLGWLAAAGLSWAAAYSSMYTVTYGSGPTAYSFTVDAWGRDSNPGAAVTHQHAARFAVLLGSCAVVLAVLAVSAVFRSRRHRSEPAAAGLGLLVVGLLGGTLAAMQLQVDSVLTGLHSQVHIQAGFGDPVRGDLHTARRAQPPPGPDRTDLCRAGRRREHRGRRAITPAPPAATDSVTAEPAAGLPAGVIALRQTGVLPIFPHGSSASMTLRQTRVSHTSTPAVPAAVLKSTANVAVCG